MSNEVFAYYDSYSVWIGNVYDGIMVKEKDSFFPVMFVSFYPHSILLSSMVIGIVHVVTGSVA